MFDIIKGLYCSKMITVEDLTTAVAYRLITLEEKNEILLCTQDQPTLTYDLEVLFEKLWISKLITEAELSKAVTAQLISEQQKSSIISKPQGEQGRFNLVSIITLLYDEFSLLEADVLQAVGYGWLTQEEANKILGR